MAVYTNKRIGTPTNLAAGGTYDLLLITFVDSFPQSRLVFDIDNTPRKITGIQKVAQVFMKTLFTRRGSNVIYPNQGTFFSDYVINANRVSSSDPVLISELTQQITEATSQTQYALNTFNSDLSSQLKTVSLLGIDTGKESIVIYMRLLTNAGEMASVAVPFPQLDLQLST